MSASKNGPHQRTAGRTLLLIGSLWLSIGSANAAPIISGFSFSQVNYLWPTTPQFVNSDTVQFDVNVGSLPGGYVNVSAKDATGTSRWVVQNLPVRPSGFAGTFTSPSISTSLGLGAVFGNALGTKITSVNASVDLSPVPLDVFSGSSFQSYSLSASNAVYNAQGFGSSLASGRLLPPEPNAVSFAVGGLLRGTFQPNHPNVETAVNQCFPAAVANSLTYLQKSYGIKVPDPNVPGRGDPATSKVLLADDTTEGKSLVGRLDLDFKRQSTSRLLGEPVEARPGLEGKLTYLGRNGLGDLIVKHQGLLGDMNVPAGGVTSVGKGLKVTAKFIADEIAAGEDVELGFLWDEGGHFVDIVGAGSIFGVPWIAYAHDRIQTDDTMGTGVDFSFLVDTDLDGHLNLVNEKGVPNAAFLIAQSVPEPATILLLIGGISGLFLSRLPRAARAV